MTPARAKDGNPQVPITNSQRITKPQAPNKTFAP